MVMAVVVVVVPVLVVIVIVMVLVLIVVVVVMMLVLVVIVVVMMLVLVVIVVVMVLVLIVIVVVMVLVLIVIVVVMVLVLFVIVIVMVLVIVVVRLGQVVQRQQERGVLDGLQHRGRVQLVPGRGDDARLFVVLAQQGHALFDLFGLGQLGAAEYDGLGALDLVDEELAEVVGVHAALAHVRHGGAAGQLDLVGLGHVVHHAPDVGQLADAGGLDQYAVGVVGIDQLAQGLREVAHQRAADAAGVQLGDLYAGLLHEAAVDAHFAVLVLQQHDLFTLERAAQQLFDQRGLAGSEKAGDDVYLCHVSHLSCILDDRREAAVWKASVIYE